MIVDAVLGFFADALTLIVGVIPTCAALGLEFFGLSGLASYMGSADIFIDLGAFGAVLGIVLAVEAGMLAVNVSLWLWRLMPFT